MLFIPAIYKENVLESVCFHFIRQNDIDSREMELELKVRYENRQELFSSVTISNIFGSDRNQTRFLY